MADIAAPLEILQAYIDHVRNPNPSEIVALLGREGVPASAIESDPDGDGYAIGVATVERLADGRFEFAEHEGEAALIVVARDEFGDPADHVPFRRNGFLPPSIAATSMLGAQEVLAPRVDPALSIHRSALDWLRSNRAGVVLIDEKRAAIQLRDFGPFRAADVEHGLHIRKLFTFEPPAIVVPQPVEVRCAA